MTISTPRLINSVSNAENAREKLGSINIPLSRIAYTGFNLKVRADRKSRNKSWNKLTKIPITPNKA